MDERSSGPWPELVGAEEDLERAARERERCARLMFGWPGPSGLNKELAAAVRGRARAVLETKTEAEYWCAAKWRHDVFGWPSELWKGMKYEPETRLEVVLTVRQSQADLWGLAAWAEGEDVADWVWTCASLWAIELGRVADEARRQQRTLGMSAVEGLRKLADELHAHGEFRQAGLLNSLSLLLGAGYEATLVGLLEEMAANVAAERLCQHLDPEQPPP